MDENGKLSCSSSIIAADSMLTTRRQLTNIGNPGGKDIDSRFPSTRSATSIFFYDNSWEYSHYLFRYLVTIKTDWGA